jgi:hypothetical protein
MISAVTIARGNLYLPKEVYDQYFAGLAAVVLHRQETDLMILPVRHAPAGGYILKIRNASGDRVASAPGFFRSEGIEDDEPLSATTHWDAGAAGLRVVGIFQSR